MRLPIAKIGPTGAVVGLVGFCLWPWLFSSTPGGEGNAPPKMPEIPPSMLSPSMAKQPKRDPFCPHDSPATSEKGASPTVKAGASPGQRDFAGGAKGAGAKGAAAPTEKPGLHPGLVLKGTSTHGRQRLALINGKVYAEGDTLTLGEASAPPYVVSKILPYKVVLTSSDKALEVTYSDIASPNSSPHEDKDKKAGHDSGNTKNANPRQKSEPPPKTK